VTWFRWRVSLCISLSKILRKEFLRYNNNNNDAVSKYTITDVFTVTLGLFLCPLRALLLPQKPMLTKEIAYYTMHYLQSFASHFVQHTVTCISDSWTGFGLVNRFIGYLLVVTTIIIIYLFI
jgi:hypothetical protein